MANKADDKKTEEVVEETNAQVEPEQPEVQQTPEPVEPVDKTEEPKAPNWLQKFLTLYKSKKKITIPVTIVVVLAILLATPVIRYELLGLVIKKDVAVTVVDSRSGIEITSTVTIDGKETKDPQYPPTFHKVPVGKHHIKVTDQYYKDHTQDITVTLGRAKRQDVRIQLEATGYTLAFIMHNKITGKPVQGVHIKSGNSESISDNTGRGLVVVDSLLHEAEISVFADGYVTRTFKQAVLSDPIPKYEDTDITPSGKVYFLSKRTGKIDLVKTDLDGANRETVLAGTGKEEDTNTVLLASRDWKYLALLSKRDDTKAKLYLVETGSDKVTEIDSGDAIFSITGWQDHFFVYKVSRENVQFWQNKQQALKSYNAETKTLATIDESNAEGTGPNDYVSNSIDNIYSIKDNIVYTKTWTGNYYSSYRLAGKRDGFYTAKQNGTSKQTLKDFDAPIYAYINATLSEPEEIYYSVYTNDNTNYFKYENGKVDEDKSITSDSFNKIYPTYLLSPGGQSLFWYESRDGKNTLFIGNDKAEQGKEVASLSELTPYGWYSDDYLLVSKNGSELYILPAGENVSDKQVLKISDYHKPAITFRGYGGGYGGQ